MDIADLRDSYGRISESYRHKKNRPWQELLDEIPELVSPRSGILLDIGGGNGRNICGVLRSLSVVVDLSEALLRNFVAETDLHLRVSGALPNLPFRKGVSDEILSIAVIHHLPTSEFRVAAFSEIRRLLSPQGVSIVTVWRKWRMRHRDQIIQRIKNGLPYNDLVDHLRPWKDSSGDVLSYRFYHYYTFKELLKETQIAGLKIKEHKIMGGKAKDANFLLFLVPI